MNQGSKCCGHLRDRTASYCGLGGMQAATGLMYPSALSLWQGEHKDEIAREIASLYKEHCYDRL